MMLDRLLCVALTAGVWAGLTCAASAQFPPPPPPPGSATVQDRWPETPPPVQRPGQPQAQPQPPAPPQTQRPAQAQQPRNDDTATAPAAPSKPRAAAPPPNAVACNGVFAKDSTHLKIAIKYDSKNIVFGQVDGPDGTRLDATVIYPNDPKRRLEVLWNNNGARADTSLIVINGQSQWSAPKGLKLGMQLAALEKANGKPFKISGFDKDGNAQVSGWEGGALAALPGGCKLGVRLAADTKSPEDARAAVSGDKELLSNDASLRAVKPTIGEILIGY
jgi:hypothetical protein